MSWFRKEPPPPPPRKNYLQPVLQIAVPIIFMIMIGLLGIVYNGLAEEVKTKADKESLQLMIQNQKQLIETNQKTLEKQQQNIEKQNDSIQQTLQIIKEVQIEQKMMRQQPAPSGIMMRSGTVEKPPLSPQEFQQYMKMSPEEKEAFRKLHPTYESLPK